MYINKNELIYVMLNENKTASQEMYCATKKSKTVGDC